eukprot:Gb_27282 [translate_table: standard]
MAMKRLLKSLRTHYFLRKAILQIQPWNRKMLLFGGCHCSLWAIGFNTSTIAVLDEKQREKQKYILFNNTGYRRSQGNVSQCNAMITAHARQGKIEDARHVFDKMSERNIISWNAMIGGYLQNGRIEDASQLFDNMPERNVVSWTTMIAACGRNGRVESARQVFDRMPERNIVSWNALLAAYVQNGKFDDGQEVFDKMPERNVVSWNTMITGYAQNGRVEDARRLFDKMPECDVISWTAVISGYAKNGRYEESLKLYSCMQNAGINPNEFTLTSVLSGCASLESLLQGTQVHANIIKTGFESIVSVGNALINMYGKCGTMDHAHQVLDEMPERDVVSWTSMIAGYALNKHGIKALKLFAHMLGTGTKPSQSNFTCVLSTCTDLRALEYGKQVQTHIIKTGYMSNANVGSVLVNMYAKCGNIDEAGHFFNKMSERNVDFWNAMIVGYSHYGRIDKAQQLFDEMPERNVDSWNVMIVGYAQNGRPGDARFLFDKMPEQNVISWTAIIAGYTQNGNNEEALQLFSHMQQACMKPNHSTFAIILSACASLATLEQGKQFHAYIVKMGFDSDVFVRSALVDMYAKCGCLDGARQTFDKISKPDMVSWTAIIAGYAQHGHGREALQLFEQMQLAGSSPNHITFVGVLSACSHAGLVDEAWHYLFSMSRDHAIVPRAEHYACMVDLLGRSGHLDEAEKLISEMPYEPNAVVWKALLGACRIHGNIDVGKRAAEHLFDLEPQNAAAYVLLSNIYAAAGKWDDAAKMRIMMRDRDVKKNPGCSWIEIKQQVHTFLVGDRSHQQSDEIYAMLDQLSGEMKKAGYLPETRFALHYVEEE